MVPLPLLDETELDLVVAYARDSGEEMAEAVVNAFLAADVDVFERETRLVDWVDTDAFGHLEGSAGRPLYLSATIWDHRVVMTPEDVRIYRGPRVA